MKVIEATELDGYLLVIVDNGKGSTYSVRVPANLSKAAIEAALRQRLDDEEARERRSVQRTDLLGDL